MTNDQGVKVLAAPDPDEIRAELEHLLIANILGPEGGEHEELPGNTPVRDYYMVGMLAPKKKLVEEDMDELALEGTGDAEEVTSDVSAPTGPSLFPSSIGMTFGVDGDVDEITVSASWGRYERTLQDEESVEGKPRKVWRRIPSGGDMRLALVPGDFSPVNPELEQDEVVIRGRVRKDKDHWTVTVFLVNDQEEQKTDRDEPWLFQVSLAAMDPEGRAVFRRPIATREGADDGSEEARLDMAYRDTVEFVVGHGTGVHAEPDPDDRRRALGVKTVAVPVYEVPKTDPPTAEDYAELSDVVLDMASFDQASDENLAGLLRPLTTAYRAWIERQRGRVGSPRARLEGFEQTANRTLADCSNAASRIEAGIDLLDPSSDSFDQNVVDAFRFANKAMWLQRVRTMISDARRKDPQLTVEEAESNFDRPINRSWRPFQLAFILINLPSLSDPKHIERQAGAQALMDLLWFPTGGGKTEAYLGLSAFTMAIRRLQGTVGGYDGSDGVAILMRYTLRLLTVQQFQRAAALLCACERIRLEAAGEGDERWGGPFRLGLWVGYAVSPTKADQARKFLEEKHGTAWYGGGANPVQITFCPWCGAEVTAERNARFDSIRRRTIVYCGDVYGRCPFSEKNAKQEGLPLVTVDEEIYRLAPSMIIATADKFAQLPWQGATRVLFGRVTRRCERHGYRHADLDAAVKESDSHPARGGFPKAKTVDATPLRPPDLIIQDEMHLISGPLGSLMGLYETAIDELASWTIEGQKIRPKVIASTATVRRADKQAHNVFWRRLEVFPPPGIDAKDSFFALQRSTQDVPGRRYLGVCAPGRRIKAVEIRLYVALMGAAQRLFEIYGTDVDPWMTLVGYFSALRELAGMSRLVNDDVSNRLRQKAIQDRGLGQRFIGGPRELTSRIDSGDIPLILDDLSLQFIPQLPGSNGKKSKDKSSRRPVDVLLATNMISVGVDVPRLGLMVVGGQPKATAEYIQATSRVGRSEQGPGLVITALNWARPRDLSHYETFEHFHATFYRHVEAMSVTPFAPRALDRGLTGTLIGLLRNEIEANNSNDAAQKINPAAAAKAAMEILKARGAGVTSDQTVAQDIEKAVNHRTDSWKVLQNREAVVLGYRDRKDGKTVGLLKQPGEQKWDIWTSPTSLRDVEVGINLLLRTEADDDGPKFDFLKPSTVAAGEDGPTTDEGPS